MLLAIDIGNTNIVVGAFAEGALKGHWRLSSDASRTADEYGLALMGLLAAARLDSKVMDGAIIASVVPRLTSTMTEAVFEYLGLTCRVVTHQNCLIPVLTDNPEEVGADRLVNAVAAYSAHRSSLIVVDFGTAVTFDYVTERGEYAGGIIAPGIGISSEALFNRTAKLPLVEAGRPSVLIGKNTVDSMRSGLFYGFLGLVDGIIERMLRETGGGARVVSTGGLAPLVIGESSYITGTDEFLTLRGLKIIYEGKM
ncbi:type III pantothenate kinase [Anaerolineae bacterium]|nr:type III pantothenate kinase [Anaerolineae bacterium]